MLFLKTVYLNHWKKLILKRAQKSYHNRYARNRTSAKECTLDGVIDIANDCSDTDLSVNHDKYLYGRIID